MDSLTFTAIVVPLIVVVASAINSAMKAFDSALRVSELWLKRKGKREAQTTTNTCQHKSHGARPKRRRQRRE